MNRRTLIIVLGLAAVALLVVLATSRQRRQPPSPLTGEREGETLPSSFRVREPAVAGPRGRGFYPDDEASLSALIDELLAKVEAPRIEHLRALVAPHAGLAYSGLTAAFAYRQLVGREIDTVVILAPSHSVAFEGVSILDVDAYRTPLGLVRLSPKVAEYRKTGLFPSYPPCHEREHSLEVQLPFLQKVLSAAKIIPIVFGRVDEERIASVLAQHVTTRTIVVASSDLSHFHSYQVAQQKDRSAIDAMLALDTERLRGEEACGKGPVLALLALAKHRGWTARLLDYRNSGDTAGDKSRVVGYSAIAFHERSESKSSGS